MRESSRGGTTLEALTSAGGRRDRARVERLARNGPAAEPPVFGLT